MKRIAWILGGLVGLVGLALFTLRMAAPNVIEAGQKATERQAVEAMRTLLWAQDRFIERYGRAGRLGELAGRVALQPPLGSQLVRPPLDVGVPLVDGEGAIASGYVFRIHVLDAQGQAVPEGAPVPAGASRWIAYAWPEKRGESARFAFCINEFEDILQSPADGPHQGYDGVNHPPAWNACPVAARLAPGAGGDGGTWDYWRGKRTRRARASDP